jgi:hypothetical protein
MGQKFLQITENAASSQTEKDRHSEDPGLAFNERSGVPRRNFVNDGMPFSTHFLR